MIIRFIIQLLTLTAALPLPATAASAQSDNLEFAWITGTKSVRLTLKPGTSWPNIAEIQLHITSGEQLKISKSSYTSQGIDLTLEKPLSFTRNVTVSWRGKRIFAHPTMDLLNTRFFYSGQDLGATVKKRSIEFKIWSPNAENINLVLYDSSGKTVKESLSMVRGAKGVWKITLPNRSALRGLYHYQVTAFGRTKLALDPYAKSMGSFDPANGDTIGKAVVIETPSYTPYSPINNIANEVDMIAYEAHVRDFSISPDSPAPPSLKGTFEGFTYALPHIQQTGFTHIQFQPLQNFYTVNETDQKFQGDGIPASQVNYNWGYDSQSFFSPEGWFSSNPSDPTSRINEARSLFKSIHNKGLGVTIDVVYNHIYNQETLDNASPGTYLRRDQLGNISYHTGAGATIESRLFMGRKLIVDSLLFWKDFYQIDGFRFDLMGFLDHETMRTIRKALGPNALLYGEAWNFTDLPWQEATTKSNLPCQAHLGVFNDTTRNAILGQHGGKGFVQGLKSENDKLRTGIIAAIKNHPQDGLINRDSYHRFATKPSQSLNYFSIHDGFTSWDKVNLAIDAPVTERQRRMKMAFAMLLSSQGRVIVHGGSEFGRSKPLAPNDPTPDRAHTSDKINPDQGFRYLHENSYRSPDTTNAIRWSNLKKHSELSEYVRGLIELRRRVPALRYKSADSIRHGLEFIGLDSKSAPRPFPESAGYSDFRDPLLTSLRIEFVNAPVSAYKNKFYLAGEFIPGSDKNPVNNPLSVFINGFGKGAITITRDQLNKIDTDAWADNHSLQFKLVQTPGKWNSLEGAYTTTGNNSIAPYAILIGNRVKIDLSVVNYSAGAQTSDKSSVVAYRLNNQLENDSLPSFPKLKYSELIVIHSNSNKQLFLPVHSILHANDWDILVDPKNSGVTALTNSEAMIISGGVIFPRNGTTIIGKKLSRSTQ